MLVGNGARLYSAGKGDVFSGQQAGRVMRRDQLGDTALQKQTQPQTVHKTTVPARLLRWRGEYARAVVTRISMLLPVGQSN